MNTTIPENVLFSVLQPHSSSTTYALPSDGRIGNGGALSDDEAKTRRVQEQIKLRLAEKSTLPRQNGKASNHPMSDYGGSSTMKYSTYSPGGFTSKSSFMYTGSRTMGPRMSQRADFSSRSSGPAIAQFQRMSVGGGVGGGVGSGGFYTEDAKMGVYQGSMRQQNRIEPDAVSVHSMRQIGGGNPWIYDDDDAGSLISERDSTTQRQFTQSAVNGYSTQMRQGTMNRSLSGTIYPNGGMSGGGTEYIHQQHSFKGPAFRTINRIANRNRMSVGSMSGNQMSSSASSFGRDKPDGGFIVQGSSQGNLNLMRQGTLSRTMSMKSIQSVGRGVDIYGGQMELGASMGTLNKLSGMDLRTAVEYIRDEEPELNILGAAFIQHQCYNSREAKDEVREYDAIGDLVNLFNNEDPVVRRYSTGAVRNLVFENMHNKVALVEKGGITQLVRALEEDDEELHKNVTGILWNLSSKEKLKERLAKDAVPHLTGKILVPLAIKMPDLENNSDTESLKNTPEAEIFCNTTGCFRNLSSEGDKTRQLMRSEHGLVASLVTYIKVMVDNKNANDKGVENCVCILRNLSYQLYTELPPAIRDRLGGPSRDTNTVDEAIGCFTPQSKKAKNKKNRGPIIINEVGKSPTGMDWLWHPDIIGVYHDLLRSCDTNANSREAAAGALQNLTHGDERWAMVLSGFAEEQHKMIPTMLKLLSTERDIELRSITGFLRNLSRNTKNKDMMAEKVIKDLLEKLPEGDLSKALSFPVVVNICGIFNNLVIGSSLAAKEIALNGGLNKLRTIRDTQEISAQGSQAARSAGTVLTNMYYYKKLHKVYKEKGFVKEHFVDRYA